MAILAKTQKRHEWKSERGGAVNPPPLLRERVNDFSIHNSFLWRYYQSINTSNTYKSPHESWKNVLTNLHPLCATYSTGHSALAWFPRSGNLHMWCQYTRKAAKSTYPTTEQYHCYVFCPKSLSGVYSIASTITSRRYCKTRNTVL